MTLLEKHGRALADLVRERRKATDEVWQHRLDQKIRDMRAAIIALVNVNS